MRSSESFQSHAMWKTLQAIEEEGEYKKLEASERNYLIALIEELKKKKEGANPYYVPADSLDLLNNYLDSIRSYVPANPSQVIGNVEKAFTEIATRWPAHNGRYVADIAKSTYDKIVDDVVQRLEKAQKSVDRVEELENSYTEKVAETEKEIIELRSSAEATITRIENDEQEKVDQLQASFKQAAESAISKSKQSLDDIESDYLDSLKTVDAEANKILKEVQNTSNAASSKVIADSYGEYAEKKEKQTATYDRVAIGFTVIGIFLIAFALIQMQADETSVTVLKLAVSVASFTVSGFLFRRGTFYQREAKAAKRTELTLKQYRAFIANLPSDEQKEITRDIAERVFIKGEIDDNDSTLSEAILQRKTSSIEAKDLVEVLRLLAKSES